MFQVVIEDVFDKDHCVCKTDEGRVLEGISQILGIMRKKSLCICENKDSTLSWYLTDLRISRDCFANLSRTLARQSCECREPVATKF